MGLKNFHLLFILLSFLLALGSGAWFFLTPAGRAIEHSSLMGGLFVALGLGLVAYGAYFLKKIQALGAGPAQPSKEGGNS